LFKQLQLKIKPMREVGKEDSERKKEKPNRTAQF
jgi:hypothetical protein